MEKIIANEHALRELLSERGLPLKLQANFNATEWKLHTVLCAAYDFRTGLVDIEVPQNLLHKLTDEFKKVWMNQPKTKTSNGKISVLFGLTERAVKTVMRTGFKKDQGIFKAKINQVELHTSWAKNIKPKDEVVKNVDWTKAETHARKLNEYTKQNIIDGKTFNAQKDNPWARKNLKNKGN